MKINNFIKYVGGDGIIFERKNGERWLFYNNTGMKMPDDKNIYGTTYPMPDYIEELISDDRYEQCELVSAFLPAPDAKPSELLRQFKASYFDNFDINIPNKIFGFIEKSDETFINEYCTDDDRWTALLITDEYGSDREFKMIYIVKD